MKQTLRTDNSACGRKLKALGQMPRDVQLLVLQHAAPLQPCVCRLQLDSPLRSWMGPPEHLTVSADQLHAGLA